MERQVIRRSPDGIPLFLFQNASEHDARGSLTSILSQLGCD